MKSNSVSPESTELVPGPLINVFSASCAPGGQKNDVPRRINGRNGRIEGRPLQVILTIFLSILLACV